MKFLLVCGVLALCFVSVMMDGTKECSTDADCNDGQCCVEYRHGFTCQAYTEEGRGCLMHRFEETEGTHYYKCPCLAGLKCTYTKETEIAGNAVKYDARCVKPEA